ncbi:hypothetical protein ACEPAH_4069 [Sanghuangporus vaninii]
MSDAQSQVLILSELQGVIFSALDKQSQSRCARVCKAWTNSSLQHLWKELDCVLPLLNLLGEFTVERDIQAIEQTRRIGVRHQKLISTKLSISQPPTEGHWNRFEAYSRLVMVLQISSLSSYDFRPYIMRDNTVCFDATLLGVVCRGQKYPRLLPNIHSLRIHLSASDSPSILPLASVFLGSLSSMELVIDIKPSLPATIWTPLKIFLNDAMTQTPGLECFSLKAYPGVDSAWTRADDPCHSELDKIIREFLTAQAGSLTTLKVNSTMLTTELLELVSKFPQLRSIQNSGRRLYYTPRALRISQQSQKGAFSKLKHLYLPTNAQSLCTDVAALSPTLRTITTLTIGCRDYVTPEGCGELFAAISDSCSALSCLEIIACTSMNIVGGKFNQTSVWLSERPYPDDRVRRLRCLSLAPIFALQYLSQLTIMLDFVLLIDDHGLQEALKDRRTPFDVLQLSWTPRRLNLDQSCLTFNALNIVAEHCPRIRILSLLLHVGPTFVWSSPSHSFAWLEEMNFGLSTIEPHLIASTAMKFCDLFRNHVPDISASLHTGHFEKCQFEFARVQRVEENRRRWMEVVRAFNRDRGVEGGKSLRKFARSEGRVVVRYEC